MIDGPLEPYERIQWPVNWHIHNDQTHLELGGAMNALFKLYSNEKSYGFITDHGRPVSPNWATELEKAAGDWGMSLCDDKHPRFNPRTGHRRVTEATCFGGELIKTMGWFWADFVIHLYGDDVWEELTHELDLAVYCDDVKVQSLQFSNGEFPVDENHQRKHRGVAYSESDRAAYFDWRDNRKQDDLKKIRDAMPGDSITIACVKWGEMYGPEYVNILCNMVARNLPQKQKVKYVCFTDNPEGINKAIETRPLPENVMGWWSKLYLFKQGIFEEGERVVYFDLDTVIVGPLDDIVKYNGDFAILRDFYRPQGLGSGVMMWKGGFGWEIWDDWLAAGKPKTEGGDQAWIERLYNGSVDLLQELYPQAFVSYKVHAHQMFPKDSKVVCFHGEPKPHNAAGWVEHVWKLGGGTSLSLEVACNTNYDNMLENIKHSLSLNLPLLQGQKPHNAHACIVGGGPSLGRELENIRTRQFHGQQIFATNNAYKYLKEKRITSDFHLMMDSRVENTEFVPEEATCLYASRCHPAVFDKASKCNVTLWHELLDGIQEITKDDPRETSWVGGGSTIGLKAMAIAYILGYRNLHLYGMDSSYKETHHSYPQSLNDEEITIDVIFNGKPYKCAPWMVTQAEEFKELVTALVEMGCTITVHGTGLIPDISKVMQCSTEEEAA